MSAGFYAFMGAGNGCRSDSGEILMIGDQHDAEETQGMAGVRRPSEEANQRRQNEGRQEDRYRQNEADQEAGEG
jgi:hypothetical protein